MAFAEHIRMTALGRLGSASGERFSYGLNIAHVGSTPFTANFLTPNADVWEDFAADVRAFHGSANTNLSSRAILEEVKFAVIGTDGKYKEDPVVVNVVDCPGGSVEVDNVQQLVPPQSALVISLVTARRGPTGKGRFYLPMPVVGVSADTLQISDGFRDSVASSAQTFLNNLNNQPGMDVLDLQVVVASTKGYNTPVTGVRVGRVLDTVRSRRRGLLEAYDPPLSVGA